MTSARTSTGRGLESSWSDEDKERVTEAEACP